MSVTLPFESVADTAFLTAFCRAVESDRPDAHFHDPHARLLAGARGERLLRRVGGGESSAAGCIVRTCLFDELILELLRENAFDTVLNLGSGLDTRPYRLPLSPSIHWIEVDTPSVLAYKARKLAADHATCRLERLPLDATDDASRRALFESAVVRSARALVITEGLLVYMTREQVASLAKDLYQHRASYWLTDLVSPHLFGLMSGMFSGESGFRDIRWSFAPEEGPDFFRPHGWEVSDCRWCLEEGRRLDRWLLPPEIVAKVSVEQWEALRRLTAVVRLNRAGQRNVPMREKEYLC